MKNKKKCKSIDEPGNLRGKDKLLRDRPNNSTHVDRVGESIERETKECDKKSNVLLKSRLKEKQDREMENTIVDKTGPGRNRNSNFISSRPTVATIKKPPKPNILPDSRVGCFDNEDENTKADSSCSEKSEICNLSDEKLLPIHIPVIMNDINKVRYYFERDPKTGKSRCNPDIRCLSDGSTALLIAIRSKKTEVAKILLINGADITLTDNSGDNALLAAVKTQDANVINLLWPYRKNLNVNHTNYHGLSALHLAADRRWEGCLNFLLQNRADPNCMSTTGETPLMLAAAKGDTKTVDNLLKSNADILIQDHNGNTCICKAYEKDKKDMAIYLLQKIPDHKKDLFIKSRLDLMADPLNPEDEKRMLENSYYPILHQCTGLTGFKNSFYNLKAIERITEKLAEYNQNFELTLLASHLIFCLMFRFTQDVDVKFVRQFIRCKGPEVVIHITKHYTEQWKIAEREIISIFLPMIGLSELAEGKTWLKKNYVHVSEYLNHFDKSCLSHCLSVNSDCHWCPDCDYHKAISLAWDRFHFVMDSIQTEERERHMSELLEDEAREKERQLKKREKKKQKKQEKIKKTEETPVDEVISAPDHSHDGSCDLSEQFGNANTNAGQDTSKFYRKKRSISDSSNSSFYSPPTPLSAGIPYYQKSQPNHDQMYSPPKSDQWTTIQTKRQLQKEKKTPRKEKISDSGEKGKRTPRKSPRKRNTKNTQILHGNTFISGPVSGTARWADIAKSSPRKLDTVTQDVAVIKPNIPKPAVRNISFASVDFPSLCMQEEGKESPEKIDNTKPTKFTYHFHDPISEPCQVQKKESPNISNHEQLTLENKDITKTSPVFQEEIPLFRHQYEHHYSQPSADHNTDTVYISETEANHSEYCSDDDHSAGNGSRVTPATADIQDEDIYESETYPEDDDDDDVSLEDWSKEIAEIEAACAIRKAYTEESAYQPEELKEDTQTSKVQRNEESTPQHMEPVFTKQYMGTDLYTAMECLFKSEFVGPEDCQVDLFTIFKNQTESYQDFVKVINEERKNDPFFDPSIPMPNLEIDTDQSKSVDILFENSEEIPSWFTDNDGPSHEETWEQMQRNSIDYANQDVPSTPQNDFSRVDPAIIGYKNMTDQCNIPKVEPPQNPRQNSPQVKQTVKTMAEHLEYVNHEQDDKAVNNTVEDNAISYGPSCDIKQTAIIKPLPNIQKHQVPVLNAPFGQSILENACQLEHQLVDDEIGYPDELNGVPYPEDDGRSVHTSTIEDKQDDTEEAQDDMHFPGFHTNTKLSGQINKADFSVFYRMQQIQYEQLANYYNINKQHITANHPPGSHQDNFVYYAQCAGMDRQTLDNCLSGNTDFQPQRDTSDRGQSKTFRDIHVKDLNRDCTYGMTPPRTPTQDLKGQSRHQQASTHTQNRPTPASPMSPAYPYGQYAAPTQMNQGNIHLIQATQAAMAATVMNQIKEMYASMYKAKMKSVRWKDNLWQLRNLPAERQMGVGKIVIPKAEQDRIYISRVSSGPVVLGFLSDGTEVAVKIIDWKTRDFTLDELQHLVNLDVSKYFMNKYLAFCSQDGYYYIAMTLYEYSLPEYMAKLDDDSGVDMSIARNKLVWQFMRGLASLHQHCLMVHGDLKPENVVIDLDGNIKITGYGICKNINRDATFVEYSQEDKCWLAPEILVHKQKVSFKSDIFVAGMLMYYILSGGQNTFGSESSDIIRNITQHSYCMDYVMEEAGHLLSLMLSVNKSERPCISDALRHPYFWADEKRLRFILIAGSDVLRDLKSGIPMDGSVRDSMINIIGSSPCNISIINWIPDIEPVIINEMRVFRQYKNNVVELVLFIYNCCLHFDKMSDAARGIIDEPCKYFLTKFPTLFMFVYRAIKTSNRTDRTCYKPFF